MSSVFGIVACYESENNENLTAGLHFDENDLSGMGEEVARFARLEGLEAHARSMAARKKK